jgi:hypothetical protein
MDDDIGPFSHHRQDLLRLARSRFAHLLDHEGGRLLVFDEPALTVDCYVLGEFGIELQFDWRDYVPADMVCRMEPDGQPPPGYLINAGRQVRYHLNRALPALDSLNPKPGKWKRDRTVQEYLRRSLDISVHLIEGTADLLRDRVDETLNSARQLFAAADAGPSRPPTVFPRRSYVQLVPPTEVP